MIQLTVVKLMRKLSVKDISEPYSLGPAHHNLKKYFYRCWSVIIINIEE